MHPVTPAGSSGSTDGPFVFVLGMHRSGTSCLTGALEQCGLFLGEVRRTGRHNPKGYFESLELSRLHDQILGLNRASWHNPPEVVVVHPYHKVALSRFAGELTSRRPCGLKDPRILLMLDDWLRLVEPPCSVVGTFRHPAAVADSLANRNGLDPSYSYRLWLHYNKKLVALHRKAPFPIVEFNLHDASGYCAAVADAAASLGLTPNIAALRRFVESRFEHHAASGRAVPDECRELYDYLKTHCLRPSRSTEAIPPSAPGWDRGSPEVQQAVPVAGRLAKKGNAGVNPVMNIVYTPGTVATLAFMVKSLLRWSDCTFRLVSNACFPPEQRSLQELCNSDSRLTYLALPTSTMWSHGKTLNYLHSLDRDGFFGFMDSDIFATGEFLPDLLGRLKEHTGVFSCAPVWSRESDEVIPEDFRMVSGPCNRTESGIHIGGTYLAIYDNEAVCELRNREGVGFDGYSWDNAPPSWKEPLSKIGLDRQIFDTGKMLNALLVAGGHSLLYVDQPNLVHLGGVSFIPGYLTHRRWWKGLPGAGFLRGLRSRSACRNHLKSFHATDDEIRIEMVVRLELRNRVREYFWQLLQCLADGRTPPPLPKLEDREVHGKLSRAADALVEVHGRDGGYPVARGGSLSSPEGDRVLL